MEVYAAMVDRMDQNIGRLVNYLKSINEFENTLILFLSDNGACAQNVNRSPGAEIGTSQSFVAYGKNWANVGNTPYLKYKRYEHEGGILTPMIAHWPSGIKKAGRLVSEPVHIIDIMPTCLEIAGTDYPKEYVRNTILPHDGQSFFPAIQNKKLNTEREFFWEHEGNKAIQVNDWKLVKLHNKPWELYDLGIDPTELRNLAQEKKHKAKSLHLKWNRWAKEVGVNSWPVKKK